MDHSNRSDRTDQVVAELERSLLSSGWDGDRVQVLGHRGTGRGRLENSVPAVAEALRQGADGVEVDIRLTADGTLVCIHEASVLTRGGARQDVATSASADLRGDAEIPLATLTEVLAAAQRPVGSRVVVEAKPVPDPALAGRTAEVLADVLRTDAGCARITISSFDADLLALIRTACADLPVVTALLGDKQDDPAAIVRRADEDGHDEVHLPLGAARITPDVVETARRLGLAVALWTVNSRQDLRLAAELGVDAVITDDVPAARLELDRAAVAGPSRTVALAA